MLILPSRFAPGLDERCFRQRIHRSDKDRRRLTRLLLDRIPYRGVPVGTWKRQACGKGNASKDEVIAAMRLRGFEPADDNEADAIAILLWAIETNGGLA